MSIAQYNELDMIEEFILDKIKSYPITKKNIPIRAELAEVHHLVKAMKKIVSNRHWVDVNDGLPSVDGEYLVYRGKNTKLRDGSWLPEYEVVNFSTCINRFNFHHNHITHWQLLPKQPISSQIQMFEGGDIVYCPSLDPNKSYQVEVSIDEPYLFIEHKGRAYYFDKNGKGVYEDLYLYLVHI